jgi:ATP-binding cassette subfamily C protein
VIFSLGFLVRMAEKAGWKQTRILKSLSSGMTDNLQSVKPLKAMAREYLADAALANDTRKLNRALRKEIFSKEALKALQFPTTAGLVVAGFYVGLEVWDLPVATVMVLILLLTQVLSTIGKLQVHFQNLVVAESAYWSLITTIEEATSNVEESSGTKMPTLEREIALDDVSVVYGERTVLDAVNISIPYGSITTLVGFSGAGKTTVLDLVTGLIRPRSGCVRLDDVPLDEIDLRRWRRMIGYVPQENLLLHESILHNVTLGDAEVDEADAERALRDAGVWDFVAALPDGVHSTVGERGARLSGGQRQRVMIARALVHSPCLLLLDEATSALDPDSERALCATLERFRGQVTVLAISHQTALVDTADRVYRLRDGHATLEVDRVATSGA